MVSDMVVASKTLFSHLHNNRDMSKQAVEAYAAACASYHTGREKLVSTSVHAVGTT